MNTDNQIISLFHTCFQGSLHAYLTRVWSKSGRATCAYS